MSFEDTTEQMVGILPVVVTAGVAMKMTDWLFSKEQQLQQKSVVGPKKKKKDVNVYSRSYAGGFGNFSNIGW